MVRMVEMEGCQGAQCVGDRVHPQGRQDEEKNIEVEMCVPEQERWKKR